MTTLQRRPDDPSHPGWSLGSRWIVTTTSLVDLGYNPDGALAPIGDYNKRRPTTQRLYYYGIQMTQATLDEASAPAGRQQQHISN